MEKLTGYLSGSDSKILENGKKWILLIKRLFHNFKAKKRMIKIINIDKQKRLMQNMFAPFPCKDWSGLLLTDSRGKGAYHE
jgi:hypothetical protein